MRLSSKGRYAVIAMVDVAQSARGKPVSLARIAERQGLSLAYLEQLFNKLRKSGLVQSVRGPGGGYKLAYPANLTHLDQIILAVDETIETTQCERLKQKTCLGNGKRCQTHKLWVAMRQHILSFLSTVSLADITNDHLDHLFDSFEIARKV